MYKIVLGLLINLLLLTSCAADVEPDQTPPSAGSLQPYQTLIPSPPPLTPTPVQTEPPIPTATPFLYTVETGDTMLGIALKFGISLENLMAANPDISPSAMSVGQELRIPSGADDGESFATPTPVPLNISQASCYPTITQGMWCFALVENDYADTLENISAQVTLLGADGEAVASQRAFTPLNILPAGQALPLMIFFPEVPAEAESHWQLLTATRLLPEDDRYLPAVLGNTLIQIDASGKRAQVSGKTLLQEAASQVWVAAIAYDAAGNVVGMRKWESDGGSLAFNLTVASLGPAIDRVVLIVEARQ